MKNKEFIGKFGEDLACEYFARKGYKILERNYRRPWGELDIVAKAPDKTLVFVEVKTMHQSHIGGLAPEDQMSSVKLVKFKRASAKFAVMNEHLIDLKRGWRMDLLAIELSDGGKVLMARHYENVN